MPLTYRKFEATDADYELLAEIKNAAGDGPTTVEELREEEQYWDLDACHVREFILVGDQCIGADSQCKACDEEGDTHRFFYSLLPAFRGQGLDEEILRVLIDKARKRGASKVTTISRDDDCGRIQALERLGFSCWMSDVESKLDLEHFDPSPFAAKLRQVENLGITLQSSGELDQVGIDWFRLYFDMRNQYFADVYPTEPLPGGTYEEYRERAINSVTRLPISEYTALEGKTCVGITSLILVDQQQDVACTRLTKVDSAYQRKGIATALKVASLRAAKQAGIRSVTTNNKGHIPMLQLNVQLGFQKVSAVLCYEKMIDRT